MVFTIIGMAGCGKSCMGRAVSAKLKIKLVDSDKLIERKIGKPLQAIINEQGVDKFREIEEDILRSIHCKDGEHLIVSTGGSAVYSRAGMEHLKSIGKVIYLYCGFETIRKRLGDFSQRGVVLKPGQSLLDLYNERMPLYSEYADITINCDGTEYPKYQRITASAIKRAINEASSDSNE